MGQMEAPDQSVDYSIYSQLDSQIFVRAREIFKWSSFNKDSCLAFREELIPFLQKEDPLAFYLYGQTFDLFPFGLGNPEDAKIALKYYRKAADLGLATAEILLHDIYRYRLMNIPTDYNLSYRYLQLAGKHGSPALRAEVYRRMAGLYYSHKEEPIPNPRFPIVNLNIDSTLYYYQKSLALEPDHSWTLDNVGHLYEAKEAYGQAMTYFLQSDNLQSHLKVATWLIHGKKVPADKSKALDLIKNAIEEVKDDPQYMGVIHPLTLINQLYYCEQKLTKEEVGEYLKATIYCP